MKHVVNKLSLTLHPRISLLFPRAIVINSQKVSCVYISLIILFCRCLAGFTGKRCEARRKQTVSHNTPKDISVVPNGKKDNVTSITAPPDQLSAGSVTCIVIVIVGTVVGLAVAGFFFYRKKR